MPPAAIDQLPLAAGIAEPMPIPPEKTPTLATPEGIAVDELRGGASEATPVIAVTAGYVQVTRVPMHIVPQLASTVEVGGVLSIFSWILLVVDIPAIFVAFTPIVCTPSGMLAVFTVNVGAAEVVGGIVAVIATDDAGIMTLSIKISTAPSPKVLSVVETVTLTNFLAQVLVAGDVMDRVGLGIGNGVTLLNIASVLPT